MIERAFWLPHTRPNAVANDPVELSHGVEEPVDKRQRRRAAVIGVGRADTVARAMVVLGVLLRLREYAAARPLWLDEANLASSLLTRGFGGLTQPLDHRQSAPIGFLWLERAAIWAFGGSERALRLVPLLAGTATVLVAYLLAHELLRDWAVAVATFLVATSPRLIYYSNELKQYSAEALAAVVMVLVTLRLSRRPLTWATTLPWVALAAALVWTAHVALLVVPACGAVATLEVARRRDRGELAQIAVAGVLLAAVAAADYMVTLREQAVGYLRPFFRLMNGLAPTDAGPGELASWAITATGALVDDPLRFRYAALVALLVITGLGVLASRRGSRLGGALLAAVLVASLSAAAAGIYPMWARTALWLLPLLTLIIAASVDALPDARRSVRRATAVVAVVAIAVVATPAVAATVRNAVRPAVGDDSRTTLRHLADNYQPGDTIYLHRSGRPVYAFYRRRLGLPAEDGYFTFAARTSPCNDARAVARAQRTKRVWLVFTRLPSWEVRVDDPMGVYVSQFQQIGTVVAAKSAAGPTGAFLLDMTQPTRPPVPARGPSAPGQCFDLHVLKRQ